MPKAAPKTAPLYSLHPGIQMMVSWVETLKDKTGRSVEEWIAYVKKNGPKDEAAQRDWLKTQGLGTNSAAWIAERASGKANDEDTPEGYLRIAPVWVEAQYAGKKSALRPIYDRLLSLGLGIGPGVKACPCRTMVPLYRSHVFAQIKASTNSRVDLGLCLTKLPDSKIPKRIISTGGREKKDRITHRIPIQTLDEIDKDIEKWVRTAYELDGD